MGRQEYRGANAGDFSGINELDLLLGLCRANDPYYGQLLVDKMLFMLLGDQARLKDCMARKSLLDELLELLERLSGYGLVSAERARLSGDLRSFGQMAAQHHDELVKRFIEKPAAKLGDEQSPGLTASGPPLPVLLRSLEVLRDLRLAADRRDIATRHLDIARLRAAVRCSEPDELCLQNECSAFKMNA